jgi:general secretion pathway protein J
VGTGCGFTFVEIMVSVAILGLITSIIYGAASVSFRARAEAARLEDRFHTGRVALSRMARDLSMAFLSRHRSKEEKITETKFLGEPDRVLFAYVGHVRRVAGARESDQGAVEYYLERCKDEEDEKLGGECLWRREKAILDDNIEKGGVKQVLAAGVRKLDIEYWDWQEEDWTDEWKAEEEDTGLVMDEAAEKLKNQVADALDMEGENPFELPTRVRIHLVLRDQTGDEYVFQTQTEIQMREPLEW